MSRASLAMLALAFSACTYQPPSASGEALLPSCDAGETLVGADGGPWSCFDPSGVHLTSVDKVDHASVASHAEHADSTPHAGQALTVDRVDAGAVVLGAANAVQGDALEVLGSRALTSNGSIPVPVAGGFADAGFSTPDGGTATLPVISTADFTLQAPGIVHAFAHGSFLGSGVVTSPNACEVFVDVKRVDGNPCAGSVNDDCPLDQPETRRTVIATLGETPFAIITTSHLPAGQYRVELDVTPQATNPPTACVLGTPATLEVELN